VDAFVKLYEALGYHLCASEEYEEGFEKVALFARPEWGRLLPTHAARQLSDGCWTSKLGPLEDIEHYGADAVAGRAYGDVVCYLKRRR
jgi:hypothetical protein